MIQRMTCTDAAEFVLPRQTEEQGNVDDVVAEVLARVKREGDSALFAFEAQFDHVSLTFLEVPQSELASALSQLDPAFKRVLERAKENITAFHTLQKRTGFVYDKAPGVVMGQRVIPLERVGLYVPGGTAPYPSTVLMDAIPAKLAGVSELIMCSPPGKDGHIPPDILAAAALAGVDRVFMLGGAQAIAALAMGTESVPKVDKIVGPGNIYVATAKRMVYGLVDIDMIAGPSDILVIADQTATPAYVAADLLSQAEHDTQSQAILVTTSAALADEVTAELQTQLAALPRRDIAAKALAKSAIIVTDTLACAAAISNQIAPEHLELCVAEPFALLPAIKHAGSVFLGHFAPEALGDYMAGPNHTLPTAGTARFSSPLSVDDFCKKSSFLYYQQDAFQAIADDVAAFALRERLDAHARSVTIRRGGVK